jgi:hypothetical protein
MVVEEIRMCLLPKTPRGTWLLAGLVWVAFCTWTWWALPVRPRLKLQAPYGCIPVGFLAGGHTLVTLDEWGTPDRPSLVRLWDAETGTPLATLPKWGGEASRSAIITPDGKSILVGWSRYAPDRLPAAQYRFSLHRPDDLLGRTLLEDSSLVNDRWGLSVVPSPDGKTLAVVRGMGSQERNTELWDGERQELLASFPECYFDFSPDGRWFAALALQRKQPKSRPETPAPGIVLWDVTHRRQAERVVRLPQPSDWFRFIAGEKALLAVRCGEELVIWDVAAERELARRELSTGLDFCTLGSDILIIDRAPNGVRLLSRWSWQTGEYRYRDVCLAEPDPRPDSGQIRGPLSPEDRVVVSHVLHTVPGWRIGPWVKRWTGLDLFNGKLVPRLWLFDSNDGRMLGEVPNAPWGVLSRDGRSLATVSAPDERTVQLWNVPPRKSLATLSVIAALAAVVLAGFAKWRARQLRAVSPARTVPPASRELSLG